jgi:pimeloyl-ACP methyl ester carboxylesterase
METSVKSQRRGCLFYVKRGVLGFVIIVVALIVLGFTYQTVATEMDKRNFSARGEFYTVNGHQMHLYCTGESIEGSPTVILEAGGYAESLWWYHVQNQLIDHTRVCSYDRPGLGYSEPTTIARDPITIAGELHSLLEQAGINPPYVLAGHSYGALLVRIFADQYPADVTGLVLVDSAALRPAHFNSEQEFNEWKSGQDILQWALGGLGRVGVWRLVVGNDFTAWGYPTEIVPELVALRSNNQAFDTYYAEGFTARHELNETAAAAQDFGNLPLAILWAERTFQSAPDQSIFEDIQQEMAAYSSNSRTEFVEGADHGSIIGNEEHAQHISDAILDVIESAQTVTPLES